MRIISGKFKKAQLYTVKGSRVRPTTDYVKEVIFNIVQNFSDSQVLDLYAGSGSLGLEALSRGAYYVIFVDFSERALNAMIKNFDKFDCRKSCRIYRKKVSSFLNKCESKFDHIFLDPPYDMNLVNKTIRSILQNDLLTQKGTIIVEHSPREELDDFPDLTVDTRELSRNTCVSFLTK